MRENVGTTYTNQAERDRGTAMLKSVAVFCAMVVAFLDPAFAQTKVLRVSSSGGIWETVITKYAASRFMADTGIKIEWVQSDGPTLLAKLTAGKGRPPVVDVILLD